jgi:hypothetical protein
MRRSAREDSLYRQQILDNGMRKRTYSSLREAYQEEEDAQEDRELRVAFGHGRNGAAQVVHVDEVDKLLEVPVDWQQRQQEPRVDRLENTHTRHTHTHTHDTFSHVDWQRV